MDQAGTIIILILYFVFKSILKAARKNPASIKKIPRPFPPKNMDTDSQRMKRTQVKASVPSEKARAMAENTASFHREDSIRHDHWQEDKRPQAFELLPDTPRAAEEKPFRAKAGDRARPDMDEAAPLPDLFPDLSGHGLAKAVIMQEILGKPKALR